MADLSGLKRKFRALPAVIEEGMKKQIEKEATKLVAEMRALVPVRGITIDWTWGDAPAGAVLVGKFRGKETAEIGVTIYATGKENVPRWFEFGTAARFNKSGAYRGRITAQPFFYPVYRANKARVNANLRAALRRAIKKL